MNNLPFSVTLKNSAAKAMRRLHPDMLSRVSDKIEKIKKDPFDREFEIVTGSGGTRKARVGGFRILFDVSLETRGVKILAIGSRGSVYK